MAWDISPNNPRASQADGYANALLTAYVTRDRLALQSVMPELVHSSDLELLTLALDSALRTSAAAIRSACTIVGDLIGDDIEPSEFLRRVLEEFQKDA